MPSSAGLALAVKQVSRGRDIIEGDGPLVPLSYTA